MNLAIAVNKHAYIRLPLHVPNILSRVIALLCLCVIGFILFILFSSIHCRLLAFWSRDAYRWRHRQWQPRCCSWQCPAHTRCKQWEQWRNCFPRVSSISTQLLFYSHCRLSIAMHLQFRFRHLRIRISETVLCFIDFFCIIVVADNPGCTYNLWTFIQVPSYTPDSPASDFFVSRTAALVLKYV